jgi:hypothetical protein
MGLVLGSFIAIAFLSSCLVDLRRFVGMPKSEKQMMILTVMYNFPSSFHHILRMDRESMIEMLNSAQVKEESKETAKFLNRSMSMDSADGGPGGGRDGGNNVFRGGSFDDKFFVKSTQSFEPGFAFDLSAAKNNSFGVVGGGLGAINNNNKERQESGQGIEMSGLQESAGVKATL